MLSAHSRPILLYAPCSMGRAHLSFSAIPQTRRIPLPYIGLSRACLRSAALVALLSASSAVAAAQSPQDPVTDKFTPFAVNIDRAQKQSWPGYGIYLGEGLVITASHVVGHASAGDPSVHIAGKVLKAKFVKEGAFQVVDLTLLRIDPGQPARKPRPAPHAALRGAAPARPARDHRNSAGDSPFADHGAAASAARREGKIQHGHQRCRDDRKFRLRRVRSRPAMPDGHHESQNPGSRPRAMATPPPP